MLTTVLLSTIIATPAAPSALHARLEAAVLAGSLAALKKAHAEVEASAARHPDAPGALYLMAYADWRLNHLMRSVPTQNDARVALLEDARRKLEALVKREPKNAEAHALLGSVLGELIDGPATARTLSPLSAKRLARAFKLAPNNPRVAYFRGLRYLYTPPAYGGGIEKAQAELERAHTLFERAPDTAPWPNWGRLDVYAWRGQVAAKQGDAPRARAIYEEALTLEPRAAWIEHVLLPAVK